MQEERSQQGLATPGPPQRPLYRPSHQYDAAGRRVAKSYNEELITKYIYDGDHCIAEYDAFGHLRRKYIYGPGVDQPICMIESAPTYAGTYYYHFDGLGSVVALTNASGNTVEVYEYDVYGRLGATDASHPNRILFTGREYDKETGLYYYRARYYNPQIGRFLQTDSVGYSAGMNLYRYCRNNPTGLRDPSGLDPCDPCDPCAPPVSANVDLPGPYMPRTSPPFQPFDRIPTHLNTVLPGGDYFGPYDTIDDAAWAAGNVCWGKTQQNLHECGYWIFFDPCTAKYYYTNPIVGSYDPNKYNDKAVDHVDLAPALALVPTGATIVGWGHSHPTNSTFYDVNNFSGADKALSGAGNGKAPIPGYLTPPSGNTVRYDPNTGTVSGTIYPSWWPV